MSILDNYQFNPLLWTGTSGAFPSIAQPQNDEASARAIWDQIEAQTAAGNAAADRRNAAGLARPEFAPSFPLPAPDASGPAVATALGRSPDDFGTYGSPNFMPFGFAGPVARAAPQTATPPATPSAPAPADAPSPANSQRPPLSIAPPDYGQDRSIAVGDYQMPSFGEPPGSARAMPATPTAAAPAATQAEPSVGDRLMGGFNGFVANAHTGPVGALLGGTAGLISGQGSSKNLTAQALLKRGASAEDVRAAANNPELLKALIAQYYGKDRWAVVKTGQDENGRETYMQQNQLDGTLRPLPGAPAASPVSDTVTGPDGKPITIPAGVNRKEFIKRVSEANADAATGKQTEAQAKSAAFAARMQKAQDDLAKVQNEGLDAVQAVTSNIPLAGNYLQSAKHQQYETAKSAFISAKLRAESGAAISPSEYTREEKELFPQPGDGPERVTQKAQLRAAALDEMKRSAGPGYQTRAAAPTPPVSGAPATSGKTKSGLNWSVQ